MQKHIRTFARDDGDAVFLTKFNRLRTDGAAATGAIHPDAGMCSRAHSWTISSVTAGDVISRTPWTVERYPWVWQNMANRRRKSGRD